MILEVINTLAIVIASIVAIRGINTWRKEFQGKRNIELAEEVLTFFYEAKDAIRSIRNPLSCQDEGTLLKPTQARDSAIIYERYEKRQGIFNKLSAKRYQFKARFGTDKDNPFKELNNIILDILNAANGLSMTLKQKDDKEDWKRYMSVIYLFMPDDPITPRIDQVISDIESICRPIIMGKKLKETNTLLDS